MDGKTAARIISSELSKRGISKGEFYKSTGISSATFSQWSTGVYKNPSEEKLKAAEDFLGISLKDYEREAAQETLRDDLKILLRSAKDLPPSSIYKLIAQIEKEKEDAQ